MTMEKLLSSSCRRKILKALYETKGVNIMGLVRKVNSCYTQVNQNIILFEREGIVTENRLRNERRIILNKENQKTVALLQILRAVEAYDLNQTKENLKPKVS